MSAINTLTTPESKNNCDPLNRANFSPLLAVGLFLTENGYNVVYDYAGNFSVVLDNPRFRGSATGPCRLLATIVDDHILAVSFGDLLMSFKQISINLFEPQSFEQLITIIKTYER